MSRAARALDPLFLLPRLPRTATVLGDLPGAAAALAERGIGPADAPDLVLAPARCWREVTAARAPMAVVHGAPPLSGRLGDQTLRRYLALPGPAAPGLLLPLRDHAAARGALRRNAPRPTLREKVRDRAGIAFLSVGAAPPRRQLAVACRGRSRPWPLGIAREAGIDVRGSHWLRLGDGDQLQRAVLHVVGPAGGIVIKLGRVPGSQLAFDRDRRASELTSGLPAEVARAVPALLLSTSVGGLPLSVEERVPGRPLLELLASPLPDAAKLEAVERVATWVHALAGATARPSALEEERHRLRTVVLPAWSASGASAALVLDLPALPAVLQHNDLGAWNVVADGRGRFGVVDWESARLHGLPLWDLVYFLGDALTSFSGVPPAERVDELLDLFAGQHARSAVLFRHVRQAVDRLSLPADAVGAVVTLCWLHHGLSPVDRRARSAGAQEGTAALAAHVAEPWLRHPALGPSWSAWR